MSIYCLQSNVKLCRKYIPQIINLSNELSIINPIHHFAFHLIIVSDFIGQSGFIE